MKILYRISSNTYKKPRLAEATKEYCVDNFIENVVNQNNQLFLIGDNVDEGLKTFLMSKTSENIDFIDHNFGSNGASFRYQLELASSFDDNELVLLQEDDYLYKPATWPFHSPTTYNELFSQALEYAHYVSVYDHPDKYLAPSLGGNKFISQNGVENTGLFCTSHSHWKYTNSTTCTFASRSRTIREDLKIWYHFCSGDHPYDFQAFTALGLKGRQLATSIPGRATHTELNYISPFFEQCL